jgi:hypothetical protein
MARPPHGPVDPPPDKPKRMMKANLSGTMTAHNKVHEWHRSCDSAPKCEPVDRPRMMKGRGTNAILHISAHPRLKSCKTFGCEPVVPPPKPKPRMMRADTTPGIYDPHDIEHEWQISCDMDPRCEPVAPPNSESLAEENKRLRGRCVQLGYRVEKLRHLLFNMRDWDQFKVCSKTDWQATLDVTKDPL